MDVIKHLVGAGIGLAVLPRAVIEADLTDGRIAQIQVEGWPLRRTLPVVRHAQKYVSRAMSRFLETISSVTTSFGIG
jgi:DNA-binding transcriptional LysR family regulator